MSEINLPPVAQSAHEDAALPLVEQPAATALPPAAAKIVQTLGLTPLPHEGGWFRNTHADAVSSAIYYLLAAGDFSALHSLTAQEVYHWYAGFPLQLVIFLPDGSVSCPVLGTDFAAGQRPQVIVPAGAIHGSYPLGEWALVGTTMAPAFSWEGFQLADRASLCARFPEHREVIVRLTR